MKTTSTPPTPHVSNKCAPKMPSDTRNYNENNSVIIFIGIFKGFWSFKIPGNIDFFKELRVKFVILTKINDFRIIIRK